MGTQTWVVLADPEGLGFWDRSVNHQAGLDSGGSGGVGSALEGLLPLVAHGEVSPAPGLET
jgi:hypothetical protein